MARDEAPTVSFEAKHCGSTLLLLIQKRGQLQAALLVTAERDYARGHFPGSKCRQPSQPLVDCPSHSSSRLLDWLRSPTSSLASFVRASCWYSSPSRSSALSTPLIQSTRSISAKTI